MISSIANTTHASESTPGRLARRFLLTGFSLWLCTGCVPEYTYDKLLGNYRLQQQELSKVKEEIPRAEDNHAVLLEEKARLEKELEDLKGSGLDDLEKSFEQLVDAVKLRRSAIAELHAEFFAYKARVREKLLGSVIGASLPQVSVMNGLKQYRNVTIRAVSWEEVTFTHSSGFATVKATDLSRDLREKLLFDGPNGPLPPIPDWVRDPPSLSANRFISPQSQASQHAAGGELRRVEMELSRQQLEQRAAATAQLEDQIEQLRQELSKHVAVQESYGGQIIALERQRAEIHTSSARGAIRQSKADIEKKTQAVSGKISAYQGKISASQRETSRLQKEIDSLYLQIDALYKKKSP